MPLRGVVMKPNKFIEHLKSEFGVCDANMGKLYESD